MEIEQMTKMETEQVTLSRLVALARSLTDEHADLAFALAVHAGILSPFGLTVEEQMRVTRALALAEYMHGPRECSGDHDWPEELVSYAKCGTCGLEYGQWTEES